MTVRPVAPGDETAWRDLWRGYLDFYETRLPDEIYATTFRRLTDPSVDDYHGLVAEHDNAPAGIAHYIFHRHGWQVEPTCYLQDLFVAPDVRGGGLGRRLIEAVYAVADTAGVRGVYWLTQDFNATARRLYDRVGTVTPFIKYRR